MDSNLAPRISYLWDVPRVTEPLEFHGFVFVEVDQCVYGQ